MTCHIINNQGTMSKNGKKIAYTGCLVVPLNGWATNKSNQSGNSHTSMTRTAYAETHKSGNYGTRSGRVSYKQEARATSTVKVTDKVQGSTTKYQRSGRVRYKQEARATSTVKVTDKVQGITTNYQRSGRVSYKQEARATSTVKVTNKVQGFTTQCQTRVNVKQVVYPTRAKSSSHKNINYY